MFASDGSPQRFIPRFRVCSLLFFREHGDVPEKDSRFQCLALVLEALCMLQHRLGEIDDDFGHLHAVGLIDQDLPAFP